ncbi:Hkr1p LALA0_S17e00232g [Lachancea lanzarotensis]|uniref:LALA0S17e00232g1_1 n=1 Tax=Lachancea lanzarotensis TaxID=1245769 RepID=A0A0C7MYF7_9SACH|nr:uncharacterized protein LALA0_S17e00232g [Lachancea lanzarotensis]CEP65015.1 LALA0S17e00232g1_1 [Lachancea lanzarotensis]
MTTRAESRISTCLLVCILALVAPTLAGSTFYRRAAPFPELSLQSNTTIRSLSSAVSLSASATSAGSLVSSAVTSSLPSLATQDSAESSNLQSPSSITLPTSTFSAVLPSSVQTTSGLSIPSSSSIQSYSDPDSVVTSSSTGSLAKKFSQSMAANLAVSIAESVTTAGSSATLGEPSSPTSPSIIVSDSSTLDPDSGSQQPTSVSSSSPTLVSSTESSSSDEIPSSTNDVSTQAPSHYTTYTDSTAGAEQESSKSDTQVSSPGNASPSTFTSPSTSASTSQNSESIQEATASSPLGAGGATSTPKTSDTEQVSYSTMDSQVNDNSSPSSTVNTQTRSSDPTDGSSIEITSSSTASIDTTATPESTNSPSTTKQSSGDGFIPPTTSTTSAAKSTEAAYDTESSTSSNPSSTQKTRISSTVGFPSTDASSESTYNSPSLTDSSTQEDFSTGSVTSSFTSREAHTTNDSPTATQSRMDIRTDTTKPDRPSTVSSVNPAVDSFSPGSTSGTEMPTSHSATATPTTIGPSLESEASSSNSPSASAYDIPPTSTAKAPTPSARTPTSTEVSSVPSPLASAPNSLSTDETLLPFSSSSDSSGPTSLEASTGTYNQPTSTTSTDLQSVASTVIASSIRNTGILGGTSTTSSSSTADVGSKLNTIVGASSEYTARSAESDSSSLTAEAIFSTKSQTLPSVSTESPARSTGTFPKLTESSNSDNFRTASTPSLLLPNTQSSTESVYSEPIVLSQSTSSDALSSPLHSNDVSGSLTGVPSITGSQESLPASSSTFTSASLSNQKASFVTTSAQASHESGFSTLSTFSLASKSLSGSLQKVSQGPIEQTISQSTSDSLPTFLTSSNSMSMTISHVGTELQTTYSVSQSTSSPLMETSSLVSSHRGTQPGSLTGSTSYSLPNSGVTNTPSSIRPSLASESLNVATYKESSSREVPFVSSGTVTPLGSFEQSSSSNAHYLSSQFSQSETSFLDSTISGLTSATYSTNPNTGSSDGASASFGGSTEGLGSTTSVMTSDVVTSSGHYSVASSVPNMESSKSAQSAQSVQSDFQSSLPSATIRSRESDQHSQLTNLVSSATMTEERSSFAQTLLASTASLAGTTPSDYRASGSILTATEGSQSSTGSSALITSGTLVSGETHATGEVSASFASHGPSSSSEGPINPTTSNWLPSSLVTAPPYESASQRSSFDAKATATLPQVILPTAPVDQPHNYSQITVGFKRALNYPFLIDNPLASAQIFSFLPDILTYPFTKWQDHHKKANMSVQFENLAMTSSTTEQSKPLGSRFETRSDDIYRRSAITTAIEARWGGNFSDAFQANFSGVAVSEIMPLIVAGDNYISSIAVVYFPTDAISVLQRMVLNNNSRVYSNPDPALRSLSLLINPTIPLTGLIDPTLSGSGGSSGGSSSSPGIGGGGTGGSSTGSGNESTKGESGVLNGYSLFKVTFSKAKRLLIFIPIFLFFLATWVLISFAFFGRLFKLPPIRQRLELKEKAWNVDGRTAQDFFMAPFSRRPSRISRDLEKYLHSNSFPDGNSSSESYEDDDLIPMGNNMVFSRSTGLYYQTDEDGNFYFAGTPANADIPALDTDESGTQLQGDENDPVTEEQHSTSITQSRQVSELDELDVDDEGNVELSVLDFERFSLDKNNTDTFESYNNENFYKLNQFLANLSDSEYAQSPAHLTSTGTREADSNSNSGSKANILSDESLNLMGQLSTEDENFEDYFYSEEHGSGLVPDAASTGQYSEDLPNDEFLEGADDVDDFNIDSASNSDDDEVNDVHVGEFDELDEVMYRRLSTASGLTGALGGSSSSNTFASSIPQIQSSSRVSSFGNTHSHSGLSANSATGFFDSARSAPQAGHISDEGGRPKRPPRPASIISLERDDETQLTHARLAIDEEALPERRETRDSRTAKVGDSKQRSAEKNSLNVQERSRSATATGQENSRRASFRRSIASTLHGANIFHGSGRARSSTVHEMGPHGHTKNALHKIQISGPISSENSLGWADN